MVLLSIIIGGVAQHMRENEFRQRPDRQRQTQTETGPELKDVPASEETDTNGRDEADAKLSVWSRAKGVAVCVAAGLFIGGWGVLATLAMADEAGKLSPYTCLLLFCIGTCTFAGKRTRDRATKK